MRLVDGWSKGHSIQDMEYFIDRIEAGMLNKNPQGRLDLTTAWDLQNADTWIPFVIMAKGDQFVLDMISEIYAEINNRKAIGT